MNRIYHGCFTKNADGTNKIILAGENVLSQLPNVFGISPRILRILGLKRAVKEKGTSLWARKITINTLKTKDAFIDGSLHQILKFTLWNLQIPFMLFNSRCAVIYCQQWEYFNRRYIWKEISQKKIQWFTDFFNKIK